MVKQQSKVLYFIYLIRQKKMGQSESSSPAKSACSENKQMVVSKETEELDIEQKKELIDQLFEKMDLKIPQSQTSRRQYFQSIVSRFVFEGNEHLISNILKSDELTSSQDRINYLKFLGQIDIQSADLIFEKKSIKFIDRNGKIVKKIKEATNTHENTHSYQIFNEIIDRRAMQLSNYNNFIEISDLGKSILNKSKVGFLVFAGGISSRFNKTDFLDDYEDKLYFKEQQSQYSLMEILLLKFLILFKQIKFPLYIVCNTQNKPKLLNLLKKKQYQSLKPTLVQQKQIPLLDSHGKIILKKPYNPNQTPQIFCAPVGTGNFTNFLVFQETKYERRRTLLNHIKQSHYIQYLCCLGAHNALQDIFDPYMLGLLANSRRISHMKKDLVFACTYPQDSTESETRIVWSNALKHLEVKTFKNYDKLNSSLQKIIRDSKVFANSLIFYVPSLINLTKNQQLNNYPHLYQVKATKRQVYDPEAKKFHISDCFAFEKSLENTFIANASCSSVGLLISRQARYLPIITKAGQKSWKDAYSMHGGSKINQSFNRLEESVGIFRNGSLISFQNFVDDKQM